MLKNKNRRASREAKQIGEEDFNLLNDKAYKLEHGLLKLVESLERKQIAGDWIDHLVVKESNETYDQRRVDRPSDEDMP